jgi:phosphoribosylanthranilate isomerase
MHSLKSFGYQLREVTQVTRVPLIPLSYREGIRNMWVMITGIRNVEEALNVWELGANGLGLLVKHVDDSTSGFISPTIATSIAKRLSHVPKSSFSFRKRDQQEYVKRPLSPLTDYGDPFPKPPGKTKSFCECVLVTHLIDVHKIVNLARTIDITTIQLVGKNTPEDICYIKDTLPYLEIIKSIPVIDHLCIDQVKKYIDVVDAIELDTIDITTNKFGGTGKIHDWAISQEIVQEYGHKVPIILAGGLDSDNIKQAIQTVKPFGVDVSSGIKDRDSKDIQIKKLVAPFISKAKEFAYELT